MNKYYYIETTEPDPKSIKTCGHEHLDADEAIDCMLDCFSEIGDEPGRRIVLRHSQSMEELFVVVPLLKVTPDGSMTSLFAEEVARRLLDEGSTDGITKYYNNSLMVVCDG